ncbi:MAG TPA: hypothetical protein VGF07_04040 [Stellaceae bacterium]
MRRKFLDCRFEVCRRSEDLHSVDQAAVPARPIVEQRNYPAFFGRVRPQKPHRYDRPVAQADPNHVLIVGAARSLCPAAPPFCKVRQDPISDEPGRQNQQMDRRHRARNAVEARGSEKHHHRHQHAAYCRLHHIHQVARGKETWDALADAKNLERDETKNDRNENVTAGDRPLPGKNHISISSIKGDDRRQRR